MTANGWVINIYCFAEAGFRLKLWATVCFVFSSLLLQAQQLLLRPDRIFDGDRLLTQQVAVVENDYIVYVGPEKDFKATTPVKVVDLPGQTLLPGLIEGHSHILLHPYNETSWNDQVLKESEAERVSRATVHLSRSLEAGITTMRDLGSEGAGYADVGLRTAVNKGIIPGPNLLVAGPAIVTTGSYGPKGFHEEVAVPLGAETANGYDDLIRVVRDQIGKGVDVIKVYADYRWGQGNQPAPTFLQEELDLIVKVAASSGRQVVAHASTREGMRRAILAGVKTVEHGDEADEELLSLMKQHQVALCPTLAAVESIASYNGWQKGKMDDTERVKAKKTSFQKALDAGVDIVFGGDVGVFAHGNNVLELELMNEYGMPAIQCLQSATSVNARVFGLDKLGRLRAGFIADLVAVEGNPAENISDLRKVRSVWRSGQLVHQK